MSRTARRPAALSTLAVLLSAAAGLVAICSLTWSQPAAAAGVAPADPPATPIARSRLLRAGWFSTASATSAAGVVATLTPEAVKADDEGTMAKGRPESFTVTYDGPPGDDFTIGSMGQTNVGPQYTPRVVAVAPNGPAARAGLHIGDEISVVMRGTDGRYGRAETMLRLEADVDAEVKKVLSDGGTVYFETRSMLQPGQVAPTWSLPSLNNSGSFEELRTGGRTVLFFRPGSRFDSGDTRELKALQSVAPLFDELGVKYAMIGSDTLNLWSRVARKYKLTFPIYSDPKLEVSSLYGATKKVEYGSVEDRCTYIIGADGRIERVFAAIGWEPSKYALAQHFGDVVEAVGGDRQRAVDLANPKQMTVGDAIRISQMR